MSIKTVLISGSNSGIGFAACLLFAKKKYHILAVDLAETINRELQLKLETLNAKFKYHQCDVSKHENVNELFQNFKNANTSIDVLVNNAGILGPRKKTEEYSFEDFDAVIDVNVKGVFYMAKNCISFFLNQGGGIIVNTASVAGHVGMHSHIAYCASKHAVMGMTKTMALEYAKKNIRVNAVCPGFTQTSMLENVDSEKEYIETLKYATPMKRFGEASEIANAIYYLASDESSFMTGQCIILDGGLTAQ